MKFDLPNLPIVFQEMGITTREHEAGDMDVSYERLPAGLNLAPLFRGLPGDRCPCPHWGYLLKGRVRVVYADREEIVEAGEGFYMEPGHLPHFEQDSEWIMFSPKGLHKETADAVRRNKALLAG